MEYNSHIFFIFRVLQMPVKEMEHICLLMIKTSISQCSSGFIHPYG